MLVWDETAKVLDNVFQNVWGDRDAVKLDNIMDLTVPGTPVMLHFAAAHDELMAYLHEMVAARRAAEVKEERFDLMSNLLDVNEDGTDSMAKLSDSVLTENVFLFSVAGYEQDEQEVFCQNRQSVLPANRVQHI
ncbi:hypothetical protein DICSQDRAFT_128844 [Dichomitus squalens LYAD-421 SS1]|uniref:Uncharacterized protein n=1 Tax=Dichomitus squalens (strain LYAD-421) TaxID=732165 RepID=R7SQP1_DICSQ|nr:uncharacterized protein DICSQDRAFT_128844 [Dichomitus squalens LYAD-421 SS1]EJF58406.1 hypothetical protein DICSQDRAFT_128844 [Dichomitus squalens LYAD-421 SS1]